MDNWRKIILEWLHINVGQFTWVEQLVFISIILLLVAIVDRVAKILLNKVLRKIVQKTKVTWDDVLLEDKVLDNFVAIIPAILLVVALPFAFVGHEHLYGIAQRLCWIYFVAIIMRFVISSLSALARILESTDGFKDKPVRGAVQMLQVLFVVLCTIIIVSLVLNKSPAYLLTGLGASAAILMLVFQDLMLGLVAGIQLSANKMMQVGDWVVVKDKGIDGTVIEITLTTVKIMNWDYTISTIQPQALVNGSFTNWQNVFISGGRRVARTVNIDIRSVHFMSDEELLPWRSNKLIGSFVTETEQLIAKATDENDHFTAESLRITNLTLFRNYIQKYIQTLPQCHKGFTSMVRLMEPTAQGQPMQLYFFSNETAWVRYEDIQARVFEYLLAVAPQFGIKIYQAPSGEDIVALKS